MLRDELKSRACREIDNSDEEIIQAVKTILRNPEPGFREIKTSKFSSEKFTE